MEWSPGHVIRLKSSWLPTMGQYGCKNVFAWEHELTATGFGHTMNFMRIVVEVKPRHLMLRGFNCALREIETERVLISEIEQLWRDGWVEIDTSNSYMYEEATT